MEVIIQLDPSHRTLELFGTADKNLRMLREFLGVQITARRSDLIISGKEADVNRATDVVDKMQRKLIRRGTLTAGDINNFLSNATKITIDYIIGDNVNGGNKPEDNDQFGINILSSIDGATRTLAVNTYTTRDDDYILSGTPYTQHYINFLIEKD